MSDAAQSQAAHTAREDIAFMRALAEEGARRPILGGSILLATGLIYATACAADWLVQRNPPAAPGVWMTWINVSAVIAQMLAVAIMVLRLRRYRAGPPDRTNWVFAMVWNGVGFAIFACVASFMLTAWIAHRPQVFAGLPTVILALYGVGWTVTATASRERWTWAVAVLSYLFAVAAGAFAGSFNQLLLFALAILILLAGPGALLIKRAQA